MATKKRPVFNDESIVEITYKRKKYYTAYEELDGNNRFYTSSGETIEYDDFFELVSNPIKKWLGEQFDSTIYWRGTFETFKAMLDKFFTYKVLTHTEIHTSGNESLYIAKEVPIVLIPEFGVVSKSYLYKLCVAYLKGNKTELGKYRIDTYNAAIDGDGNLRIGCNDYSKEDVIDIFTEDLGGTYQVIIK